MSVGGASQLAAQATARVDRIVIEKKKRTLTLMDGGRILKTYKVALGGQPVGAKDRLGDHKTPEGIYSVDAKNPNSQFYKALHIILSESGRPGECAEVGSESWRRRRNSRTGGKMGMDWSQAPSYRLDGRLYRANERGD
jgi:L,D-transpeptidase catalytic domain